MRISHISTKTCTFEGEEVREAFRTLIRIGHPFSVWIDTIGTKFPVPFMHGTSSNAKVEKCIQDLLRREFGDDIHFA